MLLLLLLLLDLLLMLLHWLPVAEVGLAFAASVSACDCNFFFFFPLSFPLDGLLLVPPEDVEDARSMPLFVGEEDLLIS